MRFLSDTSPCSPLVKLEYYIAEDELNLATGHSLSDALLSMFEKQQIPTELETAPYGMFFLLCRSLLR